MSFADASFDGAFLCWVLEHVKNPEDILKEVKRVVKPGGSVYITEVMNASFFVEPYSPNTLKYWMAFNDYQYEHSGDPFVGYKLGNLLNQCGFRDIETNVKTWHLDNRRPGERKEIVEYWTELLLSASDQLIASGHVSEDIVDGMKGEMELVSKDPNAVFFDIFMQAKATV